MWSKFLDPKNDFAFKKIFGTEKHKDILIHFLNDVLVQHDDVRITEVSFLNPIQDPDALAKKQSIVDVLCKDNNGKPVAVSSYRKYLEQIMNKINDLFPNQISKAKKVIAFLFLLFISATVFAADPPPLVMLKNASDQIITELNKNLGRLRNNGPLVRDIVKHILVPHVDAVGMAQSVVGRIHWQQATPQVQQRFVGQFSSYVIRTYATAFASYSGETVTFHPIRGYTPDQTRIQGNSSINRKGGPPIQVQYRVTKKGNAWLIYDFSVDGVSLVQNYRAQFADTLQQGGLALLVKKLTEKNIGK